MNVKDGKPEIVENPPLEIDGTISQSALNRKLYEEFGAGCQVLSQVVERTRYRLSVDDFLKYGEVVNEEKEGDE